MRTCFRQLILALLLFGQGAWAGSVVLVNIDPGNPGPSLDQAINMANTGGSVVADFGPGTFNFNNTPIGGSFTMIPLTGDLTLRGNDSFLLGQGPNSGRLMVVSGGSLSLHGLDVRNFGTSSFGGVIDVEGGGIHVDNSVFMNNSSGTDGGAISIFNSDRDNMISNSTFSGNSASNNGGAIDYQNLNSSGPGSLWVINTTIEGNSAGGFGCGASILDSRSPVSPDRVVFRNVNLLDGACPGPLVENRTGGFTFDSGLVVHSGDGINSTGMVNVFGTVFVNDNLIGGKSASGRKTACNDFGSNAFNSLGFNLSSDGSCDLNQPTDLPSTDPMLTRAPSGKFDILAGSPIIDSAPAELVALLQGGSPILPCGYKDANGVARPQDGDLDGEFGCDIGNVEKQGGDDIAGSQTSAYFDPSRGGEGVFVELLPGNLAFLAMFTYQPDASGLYWMVGVGTWAGNYVVIDEMLVTSGGQFGAGFNADSIVRTPVGGLSMNFPNCEAAGRPGKFAFQAAPGSGLQDLLVSATRLTNVLNCNAATPGGLSGRSGSFFDPSRDGEGIFVQWLTDGRVLLIWYTYDPDGNQFWIISDADNTTVNGSTVEATMLFPAGVTGFGSNFNPNDVNLQSWGTVTLEYTGCNTITFSYDSTQPNFGSGSFNYSRLTSISGANCDL